jgi:hypothetical protein
MADTMLMGGAAGEPAIRSIPITEVDPPPVIGLVYPHREPLMPLTAALVTEARRIFVADARF